LLPMQVGGRLAQAAQAEGDPCGRGRRSLWALRLWPLARGAPVPSSGRL